MSLLLPMLLCLSALAQESTPQPLHRKVNTDFSAWTPEKGQFRLGLMGLDYGLLDNLSLGIPATPLFLLGAPNMGAKVTAVQLDRLDISLQASAYQLETEEVAIRLRPQGWTVSWQAKRPFVWHLGSSRYRADVEGSVSPADIALQLEPLVGVDLSGELLGALGAEGGLYAGANLELRQFRWGVEYFMNSKSSLIYTSTTYTQLSGLVAAGVAVDGSTDVEVGASVRFETWLDELVPASTTLSWQRAWERFHLRLGIPLPLSNVTAYPQALELFWLLGPRSR